MQQVILVTNESLDFAFKQVRTIYSSSNNPHLETISDGALMGRISSIWDSIESTIRKVSIHGKDAMQNMIDATIQSVETLLHDAGSLVDEVHNKILSMLQTFLKNLIDSVMKLIPSFIIVGEKQFPINKISYTQKLVLGGSLKANLMEIISITSNGELQLSVEYSKT